MKKILLSVMLISAFAIVRAQVVLNELYTDPGNQTLRGEFFELYNTSTLPGGQNVNCFTIVTYYDNGGTDRGWYVMDLPNLIVGSQSFFVGAAGSPFTTQNNPLPGVFPNFNWNDPNFRNGSTGGSLTKWQVNGTGYTDVSGTIPATLNNFLAGGNGEDYVVLVFVNGIFNNGFIGGSNSGLLSNSTATPLPGILPVTSNPCGLFNINFTTLGAMEFVNSQPGTDNGYARTSDGQCGAWQKTSNSVKHTPGVTNGTAGSTGSLTTAQVYNCAVPRYVSFDITGISGNVTEADDFPVQVQVYNDINSNGTLDGSDIFINSKSLATVAAPGDTVQIAGSNLNADVLVVYKTKRGCFDKVVPLSNACAPLPIKLLSFTAVRYRSNVLLKWETAQEINNRGFDVQRKIGNAEWTSIGFVASKAENGNSSSVLNYELTDINAAKGITQYRLKQVDIDDKFSFSSIRSVRGEGQVSKTIVYPNPSNNGNVSVVFEDANAVRNITLIDMNGRTIRQWRNVTNNTIQMENLHAGFYTVRIVNTETSELVVEKIVVNKR
jgi:hypothetical protein